MSGGNSEPGRTVTSKVLSILDAFSGGRTVLTLSQISQRARLPLAELDHPAAVQCLERGEPQTHPGPPLASVDAVV